MSVETQIRHCEPEGRSNLAKCHPEARPKDLKILRYAQNDKRGLLRRFAPRNDERSNFLVMRERFSFHKQLMKNGKHIIHKPIKNEAGRKVIKNKAKNNRHKHHHLLLFFRAPSLRRQALLPNHRTQHQKRKNIDIGTQKRQRKRKKPRGVWFRKILDPKNKRRAF